MQVTGKAMTLQNRATTCGLLVEPGASNIIGDISAAKPPNATAGMQRIVSTMSQTRSGRDRRGSGANETAGEVALIDES